jgi:hypothetical protein
MRNEIIIKILELLIKLGYVSRQGYSEWRIVLDNNKIVRIEFTDKDKF